jgi:hypothetical protein
MKMKRILKAVHRLATSFRVANGGKFRLKDFDPGDTLEFTSADKPRGAVGLRTEVSKETKQEATVLTLGKKDVSAETLADMLLVRRLLGLRSDLQGFKVVYGALAEGDDMIAIQTRSGYQIMLELGADIQVPADHAADRRTYPSSPEPAAGPDTLPPLVSIQSGARRPGMHSRPSSIATTGTGSTIGTSGPRASSRFSW